MRRLLLAAPLLALAVAPAAHANRPVVCVTFWTAAGSRTACDPTDLGQQPYADCPTVYSPAMNVGVEVCTSTHK
jgi:hypothetical protein